MPFGLCNSQATYQRAVDKALRGFSNAEAFVADTIVHSSDCETHLRHLDSVLSGIGRDGIQLRVGRCRFADKEVEFLGHLLPEEGRRLMPATLPRIEV